MEAQAAVSPAVQVALPQGALSKAKAAFGNTTKQIGSTFSDVSAMFGSSTTLTVVATAVLCILIALGVAYILYYIISSSVANKKSVILSGTSMPLLGTEYTVVPGDTIPHPDNGTRSSTSFWIYINDLTTYNNLYRHVFHRGTKGLVNASPLVYIDRASNKLYVRFENTFGVKSNQQTPSISSMAQPYTSPAFVDTGSLIQYSAVDVVAENSDDSTPTTSEEKTAIQLDLMARGISIDYVPIQRWVHIAIVVNEEISQGTISAYVDGELVKVISSESFESIPSRLAQDDIGTAIDATTQPTPLQNNNISYSLQGLHIDNPGDIYVGGNQADPAIGPGFDGMVASIAFYNYDLNAKDVYDVYAQGPINNIMAKLGLPAYGVRNPIYKV